MSMCHAHGPMAAPRAELEPKEPDATHFRVGDWWLSPAGTRYRVVDANHSRAWLRKGGNGAQIARWWDAIGAHGNRPWMRESWGGQP